jgi:hypothetical protein
MMMKKKLFCFLCICTLVLVTGVSLTQADDSNKFSSYAGDNPGNPKPSGIWNPYTGCFLYMDGFALGSSVRFTVDETTGMVADYTVRLTRYPQYFTPTIPSSDIIPSDAKNTSNQGNMPIIQNTTIFTSITIDGFRPISTPTPYANFLAFQGSNVLMMFYDQEGGGLHYYTGQRSASVTFTVPEGTDIKQEAISYLIPNGKIISPGAPTTSVVWHSLQLAFDGVETSIAVSNGTISSTDRTITIQLEAYSSLDTSSWIQKPAPQAVNDFWYSDLNMEKEKTIIEDAKNRGVIPAEGWCTNDSAQPSNTQIGTSGSVASNYYTYNDPTFNMNFSSIGKNNVDIIVNSEIPAGRIVIINIQKKVLETSSLTGLLVSIDNAGITQASSLEGLMSKVEAKDTIGAYYALMGEQLITVFVYVPHFSTHTISIKTLTSSIPGLFSMMLPIFLSTVFITMVIVGLLLRSRRNEE